MLRVCVSSALPGPAVAGDICSRNSQLREWGFGWVGRVGRMSGLTAGGWRSGGIAVGSSRPRPHQFRLQSLDPVLAPFLISLASFASGLGENSDQTRKFSRGHTSLGSPWGVTIEITAAL